MKAAALYADFYHRSKIEAARAEGERLRQQLREMGVDPGAVLVEADVERALLRTEQDVEHQVNQHAGDRYIHPQRPGPA
jgi:hypothetical protein